MSNFKILSDFSGFWNKTQDLTFLRWNLYGRYPKDFKFQSSEVHQVGLKDYGSQACSLAFIWTELVSRQISATATARDRRKIFYCSNHVFKP
jgi:hypothetical protein